MDDLTPHRLGFSRASPGALASAGYKTAPRVVSRYCERNKSAARCTTPSSWEKASGIQGGGFDAWRGKVSWHNVGFTDG